MSKSDLPLSRIGLKKARDREPTAPKWLGETDVLGWDTEVADGQVFALSCALPSGGVDTLHELPRTMDGVQVLEALTRGAARSAVNCWYNLDYDAQVILSALPHEHLCELQVLNETEFERFQITYVPSKFLLIRDEHNNLYRHYDIAQFFFTSLAEAADEWLDVGKLDTVDVTKFGRAGPDARVVNEYIRDHRGEILNYVERDASLARELYRQFAREAESLDVPCGRPYSTGYLAEQTFNVKFSESGRSKPQFSVYGMQDKAWRSYFGGRFEVFKRGDVGEVVCVDINSAYPDAMRKLPDPSTLRWRKIKNPSRAELERADWGFVTSTLTTAPRRVQPFARKPGSKLIYPRLQSVRATVLLPAYLEAERRNLIERAESTVAVLGRETPDTSFPYRWIEDLYAKRKEFEREGHYKKAQALKITLNSMYGKTCQTTPKRLEVDRPREGDVPIIEETLPPDVRKVFRGRLVVDRMEAGRYMNPFLASYITGLTRLKLWRTIVEQGWEDSIVLVATDSLVVRNSAGVQTFLSDEGGRSLGAWDLEARGRGFVVGAGIYEIENGDSVKTATRGFSSRFGRYHFDTPTTLREYAEASGGRKLDVSVPRPQKIGETLWRGLEAARVGQFHTPERHIRAGMDDKRRWPRGSEISFSDLLAGCEESEPLTHSPDGIVS